MESSALELLSRAALNVQEHEGECHATRFVAQISTHDFVIRSRSGVEQIASEEEASLAAQAAATERHTEPSTTDAVKYIDSSRQSSPLDHKLYQFQQQEPGADGAG